MLKTRESTQQTTVEIVEVTTKKQLRKFVDFPNILYRNNPNFVPAFYGDDIADWDKDKNPAFSYCEGKCFLAYKNGEIVGRIGAILSHKANEKWKTRRMRFSQVDFIDDIEVSSALFAAVENWAKEKGCDEIHGPLGFCDLDREGMLVEGFEKRSMFITYYNEPYYNEHLEKLGYNKDTDWVEYKIMAPKKDSEQAQKLHRIAEHIMKRKKLHKVKVLNRFGFAPYVSKVFELVNAAYAPLYGTVDLTDKQVKKYANKFIPLLNPKYTCFVMDENNDMVAFGIAAPSVAEAMKRSRGRLFPLGWIDVLRAFEESKALDMFLIAVRPDLQGAGVNAIILDHLIQNCDKNGIEYAETGPMLETNSKILAQWKTFNPELHKRRRCYLKKI